MPQRREGRPDMGRPDDSITWSADPKVVVIYKGYNVYPQPLEELLCSTRRSRGRP